jgi:ribonucleoside-diphosphate reductase alpha chain
MASLDSVARTVLRRRHLRKDEDGAVVETPDGMFRRVAATLASAEARFGGDIDATEERFYEAMSALEFLPNSPTLMNAGTGLQQLAACFVLPIEDSLESIFTKLKQTALVHRSGGGTGFPFSKLRPPGDVVRKTGGVESEPVSFVRIFDAATEQIKQGGRRRGANMGVLDVSRPDLEEFVSVKADEGALGNFNLSVATDEGFWDAYEAGDDYDVVNPRTGAVVRRADPAAVLERIAERAWETGDPGLLFLDRINEDNPTPALGRIEATNPCGEVPELPYEACILGSVSRGHHTDDGELDWEQLRETVHLAVRFLEAAIEVSAFPVPEIEAMATETRQGGTGRDGVPGRARRPPDPLRLRGGGRVRPRADVVRARRVVGGLETAGGRARPVPGVGGVDLARRRLFGRQRADLRRVLHETGAGRARDPQRPLRRTRERAEVLL